MNRDDLTQRAAKRDTRGRLRVCSECVLPTDTVFGGVHSDRECQRCGKMPCIGGIVGLTLMS